MGVDFVPELYVDLNYGPAGELLIQRRPAPTDPAAAAERVSRAVAGQPVLAVDGTELTSPSKASASTPTRPTHRLWPPPCVRPWAQTARLPPESENTPWPPSSPRFPASSTASPARTSRRSSTRATPSRVGQTLGIVEIMKQFTEIHSDVAGVLESFEVNEGDMVNPGDAIIVVREG